MADISKVSDFYRQSTVQEEEEEREWQDPNSFVQDLDSVLADCYNNGNGKRRVEDDSDVNPFSISPPNHSFFLSSSSHSPRRYDSIFESDSESHHSDSSFSSNGFYDDDQMNFVTDLFRDLDDTGSVSVSFFSTCTTNGDFGFNVTGDGVFDDDDDDDEDESSDVRHNYAHQLPLGIRRQSEFDGSDPSDSLSIGAMKSRTDGLRVVGILSDTDSEDLDENPEIDDDNGLFDDTDVDLPILWDCLELNDTRASDEQFEWEGAYESAADEIEGLSSLIDRIEEISISSETSYSEGDAGDDSVGPMRDSEWEILLAVNNLERRNLEYESDGYDTIFEQFLERESAQKGGPPAAKSVVESLPSMALTKEDLQGEDVVCAICKDEVLAEEKVTRLPCRHYYHGECIVPWLQIRNTCPVCRYQLPTDDADYERRKNGRVMDLNMFDDDDDYDLGVRFNFEILLP